MVIVCEFGDTFGYYYDDVVGPAAGFINSLRADDWAALVAFDIRPEILTDFTKDKNQLFAGLQRLRIPAYRETSLYDAVYDTLQRLDNVDGKKAIFLLATGLDTLSKHTYGEAVGVQVVRHARPDDPATHDHHVGVLDSLSRGKPRPEPYGAGDLGCGASPVLSSGYLRSSQYRSEAV